MRRLGFAVVGGVTLLTSPAHAAEFVMDITGLSSGTIYQDGDFAGKSTGTLTNVVQLPGRDPQTPGPMVTYGGATETIVSITPASASFESGVAVSGAKSWAESNSGLDVNILNSGAGAFTLDSFQSTILPAGLGFYIQDRTGGALGNNVFTGYGENTDYSFASFLSDDVKGRMIATAGFTFDIYGDDFMEEEAIPLYTLAGQLILGFNDEGELVRGGNIEIAGESLGDFALQFDNPYSLTYNWGFKEIEVVLGKLLNPGDDMNLHYRTTAYASTDVACLNETTCLVAYSGFGDPVGRGGGASRSMFSTSAYGADAPCIDETGTKILCIRFDQQNFDPFTIKTTDISGAVPEPATWMTLILGFAGLGAALRRRRALAYS